MKNYFNQLEKKLSKEIKLENIEIIDNSHKHKGHKHFNSNQYHLKLKIKSAYLNSMTRIKAQKIIMKNLEHDLKSKIHALEISIEQ